MNTKIETISLRDADLETLSGGIDWGRKIMGLAELSRGITATIEGEMAQKMQPGVGMILGVAHVMLNGTPNIESGWDKLTT